MLAAFQSKPGFKIVLGSTSPRRADILRQLGLESFEQIGSPFDESSYHEQHKDLDASEFLAKCSYGKCAALVSQLDLDCNSNTVVISADTIIVSNDGIKIGKPKDTADAVKTLLWLQQQRTHNVKTSVTIYFKGQFLNFTEATTVHFCQSVSSDQINAYVATGEPLDKAGSYGIQAKGAFLVEKIEGDYLNVVGLPGCRLLRELLALLKKTDNNPNN